MFSFALKLRFKLLTGLILCFASLSVFAYSDNHADSKSDLPNETNSSKTAEPEPTPKPPSPSNAVGLRKPVEKPPAEEKTFREQTVENIARDNTFGEDTEIRRAAISALGGRAGTVVVMEAQTGKILTIVNQDWAIRHTFKPCSTIKLVTAVAGLNENLIGSDGSLSSGTHRLKLNEALAYSNNSYFQQVGEGLGTDKLIFYARMLGLGQPTGINSDNEAIGRLPYGNPNARIYSHGDDFRVTPLQLAVLVSAVSNGGRVVIPQIPNSRVQRTSFRGSMRGTVRLAPQYLRGVIPGMIGAAAYGTASKGVDSEMGVAGKTGSCIEDGTWVGLFASVAPVADPQFSVIVITRGPGERGRHAAAVAGSIYQVLGRRIQRRNSRNIAQQPPLIIKPLPATEDRSAADEERAAARNSARDGRQPTQTPAELFPEVVIEIKSATTRPRVVKNN